jgi:hypothetical protein
MGSENEMKSSEELASAMGVPLFTTDLHMPDYREGESEHWRIRIVEFCLDRGYQTGVWIVQDMPVLLRRVGDPPVWETWMSLSPREVESQELGIRHAFGHTVVMGLGMGWVAINIALNSNVDRVSVIEHDPEVIDLFGKSGALDGLSRAVADRMEFIEDDALQWRPDGAVDFLYADIWPELRMPETLDEVRRMQENVKAKQVYYWGQELGIHSAARRMAGRGRQLNEKLIRRCIEETIELPLLIPPAVDYASMIERVAENQRAGIPPGR